MRFSFYLLLLLGIIQIFYVTILFGMKYKYNDTTQPGAMCEKCGENGKLFYASDGLKKTCPRCLLIHLSCDYDISKIKATKFFTTDILFDRISETSTKKISWIDAKTIVNNFWYKNSMKKRYENTKIIQIFEMVNQMITKLQGEKFTLIGCSLCHDIVNTVYLEKLPCCNAFTCYECLKTMDRSTKICKNCRTKLYKSNEHLKTVMCNVAAYTLKCCNIVPTPEIQKETETQVTEILSKKNKKELQKITIQDVLGKVVSDIFQKAKEKNQIKQYKSNNPLWEFGNAFAQHGFLLFLKCHDPIPDVVFIHANAIYSVLFVEKVLMPIEKIECEYDYVFPIQAHQIQRQTKTMLLWTCFLIRLILEDNLESESIIQSIILRFFILLCSTFILFYATPITSNFKNYFVKK